VCRSCTDLARGGPGSVDVIEIDAASHGGVDDARDLRERAFFAPVASRYKVYIIDEAHMVTTQGFNALLKLVEEPPPHLKFIFATTEPEKVIGTIRSRTHHYPFRLIPPRTLSAYLSELCDKEGVKIDQAALPLVVRAGGGSARDTLSVLDQLIGGAGSAGVSYDLTTGLLGFTPDNLLDEIVDAFAASDGRSVFGVVDKVIETGQDPRRFTEDLLRRLRDLLIISAVPDATVTGLVDVPEDQAERLVAQAARFGRSDLSRAADLVAEGLTELKGATAPRLLLELICARVLLPGADDSTDGLMARMDRLEKRMSITGAPAAPPVVEQARPPVVEQTPPTVVEPFDGAQEPQERRGEPPVETSTAGEVPPPPPAPASGGLGITDVRRLWPDVVEAVKHRRRMTWILLSQHAQVIDVDDKTLTIGFNNPGAHQSFLGGGNDEIVRQVLIDEIGQAWKIEAIVDPSAQPGNGPPPRVTKPAVTPVEPAAPPAPEAVANAREAIKDTRQAGAPAKSEPKVSDADADPDDPDADDHALGGAELIQRELGASVIEEIEHN